MIQRDTLHAYCNELLQTHRFRDYCPNGLQIEGREEISSLVTGVTACQALIDAAIDLNADAILVHHGYFWKGEDASLTGIKRKRIKALLDADINLFAYHLPLDAHAELGNNAQLGQRLGLNTLETFGGEGRQPDIVWLGETNQAMSASALQAHIEQALTRTPEIVDAGPETIKRVAWCTGAAQSYFEEAIQRGVDAFISGEISEQTVHLAREYGVHYVAAGHHATERYGVQALGAHIGEKFTIEVKNVDIDNPV